MNQSTKELSESQCQEAFRNQKSAIFGNETTQLDYAELGNSIRPITE